ncbi:hypothetical protein BO70DRAFT_381122 [Aspergillus heteromorphus CBS 117.55]|uniref:Uncharacterized protein n=1 Tax=Aspergillus heteromorphus CBS 117.55 TaxID=1448321 RepID=A0A317VP71_9EURO|nr:uncharacterized protein BO70DRAFT_381122 [Aspergillus heteromorphus CBS 117.55]PWY75409.1 hypothetical protein BO70DRAFT_381122 [Aspergillus heteromorphus CBS 117.55]
MSEGFLERKIEELDIRPSAESKTVAKYEVKGLRQILQEGYERAGREATPSSNNTLDAVCDRPSFVQNPQTPIEEIFQLLLDSDIVAKQRGLDSIDLARELFTDLLKITTPDNLQIYHNALSRSVIFGERQSTHYLRTLNQNDTFDDTLTRDMTQYMNSDFKVQLFHDWFPNVDLASFADMQVIRPELEMLKCMNSREVMEDLLLNLPR